MSTVGQQLDTSAEICYNKAAEGTAPITKNGDRGKQIYEGATPIEKNIIVVDAYGNEYEATYPKRAKGLVKSGRARFIVENRICLACPPHKKAEDNKMSEINNAEQKNEAVNGTEKYSIDHILSMLEKISSDTTGAYGALDSIAAIESDSGDYGAAEKAKGIADIIRCRETTNQQLIRFYEKMYDDLTGARQKKIELISRAFDPLTVQINTDEMDSDDKAGALEAVTIKIGELVEKALQ